MNLTKAQLEQFDKEGYLFFPKLFSPEETVMGLRRVNASLRVPCARLSPD